eukprot:4492837-Lingulodinium_polyedra.AAC.1
MVPPRVARGCREGGRFARLPGASEGPASRVRARQQREEGRRLRGLCASVGEPAAAGSPSP